MVVRFELAPRGEARQEERMDATAMETPGWAGALGAKWARRIEAMERQLAPMARLGLAALAARPGERVIDLGCGGATTTRLIGEAVGRQGRVLGVDLSEPLVAIARETTAGQPQVEIVHADAAAHPFEAGACDALFSRFGTMFFEHPGRAFANLRTGLRESARAVLVCYAPLADNPWALVPSRAAETVLGPSEPSRPGAPGPFGWSDPAVFEAALGEGGFRDVAYGAHELAVEVGAGDDPDPVERAVALMTDLGPVGRRLADLDPEARAKAEPRVAEALRAAFADHVEDDAVRLGARVFVVTARA